MTDIEVRPAGRGEPVVVRVPDQALRGMPPKAGQKVDLIGDGHGHTLRLEDRDIAYVPGAKADGLIHSRALQ